MGAMQAQDFNAAKLAIGIRLSGSTEKSIEKAFNDGKIIRTHLLRPTWHVVSSEDIYWILELTVPHILPSLKTRHKNLELTSAIFNKSFKVIEKSLSGGIHLTRDEIVSELAKVKIHTQGVQAAHILLQAEMEGLVCSGRVKNKKLSYALLHEIVPENKKLTKDEALAKLALKYYTSRGPATLQDFAWWSGLSLTNAKHGLEMNKKNFISEKINTQTYWFTDAAPVASTKKDSVYFLPAYDEFLISYRDRSSIIPSGIEKTIISNNGIFRPVVLINGQVAGLWRRAAQKDKVSVELNLFKPPDEKIKKLIGKESAILGLFLNKQTETVY
jgi:hypothetical protein